MVAQNSSAFTNLVSCVLISLTTSIIFSWRSTAKVLTVSNHIYWHWKILTTTLTLVDPKSILL